MGVPIVENNVIGLENAVFDLEDINSMIQEWLSSHKYLTPSNTPKQKVTPLGREYSYIYKARRATDRYTRYLIQIKILAMYVDDIKVKGSDQVLQQGNLDISIKSDLELDYGKTLSKSYFQKFLKHMYEKYIYKPTLIRHLVQLTTETNALQSVIKSTVKKYV